MIINFAANSCFFVCGFFFSDTLIVMCFGFVQMWTSVKLRIPAFKPVLTPMALLFAAVIRDMNLRKMAFIAVVMGLALTLSTCSESWGWGKGFVTGVSSFPGCVSSWRHFPVSWEHNHTEQRWVTSWEMEFRSTFLVIWPLMQSQWRFCLDQRWSWWEGELTQFRLLVWALSVFSQHRPKTWKWYRRYW